MATSQFLQTSLSESCRIWYSGNPWWQQAGRSIPGCLKNPVLQIWNPPKASTLWIFNHSDPCYHHPEVSAESNSAFVGRVATFSSPLSNDWQGIFSFFVSTETSLDQRKEEERKQKGNVCLRYLFWHSHSWGVFFFKLYIYICMHTQIYK